MKTSRLTALLISLLSILPTSAWYYDPDGVENPLDSDITENVRYVTYKCNDARRAHINTYGKMEWNSYSIPMTAIYCEDGTVYLNQFLNSITNVGESHGYRKYWIKGSLSDDGKYIHIPIAQMVATDPLYQQQLFYPMVLSNSENDNTISIDDTTDTISIHIEEDGTLTPLGIDDTHGWGTFLSYWQDFSDILFCDAFVPTEEQPILPPPGLRKEVYDFKHVYYTWDNKREYIGKRVNVVSLNDTIFIQGISYLRCEGWSIGEKDGDTYVFESGKQPLTNVCLNDIKSKVVYDGPHSHTTEYVSATDENVIFDIDPATNSLVARSTFWTHGPSDVIAFDSDYTYGDDDIYVSSVLTKIPDGIQYPIPPDVKIEERSNGKSQIAVSGSYFDSNGYVMDVKKLFYRLYIDGKPYTFSQVEKWPTFYLAEPTDLLPYDLLSFAVDIEDIPANYNFYVTVPSDFQEVKAELVYIQDGQEISSGVGSVFTDSDKTDNKDDVYDLTGRKVNPQSLSPGIYIKGGQKFIVK